MIFKESISSQSQLSGNSWDGRIFKLCNMATTAQTMLQTYINAEQAVLSGQSWRMGERQLTRADLAEIRAGRREWEARVASEARGGSRMSVALADFRCRE